MLNIRNGLKNKYIKPNVNFIVVKLQNLILMLKKWKLMNEIINRRKTNSKITKLKINDEDISNGTQISNHFNTYFCNIASKLKGELQLDSTISHYDNPLCYLKVCNCTADCTCTRSSIFLVCMLSYGI